jgi:hypothetical protein
VWVDNAQNTCENAIRVSVLPNAGNSSSYLCVRPAVVKGNPEMVMYVSGSVETDGESSFRPATQFEQIIIDESSVSLNRTAASVGQTVRKSLQKILEENSRQKKGFPTV